LPGRTATFPQNMTVNQIDRVLYQFDRKSTKQGKIYPLYLFPIRVPICPYIVRTVLIRLYPYISQKKNLLSVLNILIFRCRNHNLYKFYQVKIKIVQKIFQDLPDLCRYSLIKFK
jgi:hypothetical protein